MKRWRYAVITLISLLIIAVIGIYSFKRDNFTKTPPYLEQQNEAKDKEISFSDKDREEKWADALADENTVIWTVPWCGNLNQKNIDYLNQLLQEDGYSVKLAVRVIDISDKEEGYDYYNKTMEQLLKTGRTDIVNTGATSNKQIALPLIEKGYLENLDSFFETVSGKKLKSVFTEIEWKCSLVDGSQYVIPSQDIDNQLYVAFNKKYISEEDAKNFSGNWEDLSGYLTPDMKQEEGFVPLLWPMDSISALEARGYQEIYGLLGDIKTGKLYNPFALSEYHNLLKFLHSAYKNGYLGKNFEFGVIGEESNTALNEGKYAILAGYSKILIAGHEDQFTIIPVKNCKYRTDNDLCTGICAKSEKKEKAFELLSLLYTNEKYANALAYGKQGEDYEIQNGYVSEKQDNNLSALVYGIHDLLIPKQGGEFTPKTAENRRAYLESDLCQKSVFLEFHLNVTKWAEEIQRMNDLYKYEKEICTAKNFESKYRQVREDALCVSEDLKSYIQGEFDEWYQNKK